MNTRGQRFVFSTEKWRTETTPENHLMIDRLLRMLTCNCCVSSAPSGQTEPSFIKLNLHPSSKLFWLLEPNLDEASDHFNSWFYSRVLGDPGHTSQNSALQDSRRPSQMKRLRSFGPSVVVVPLRGGASVLYANCVFILIWSKLLFKFSVHQSLNQSVLMLLCRNLQWMQFVSSL